jgi:excisionase family DNA binding protein
VDSRKPFNSPSTEISEQNRPLPTDGSGCAPPLANGLEPIAFSPAQTARLLNVGRTFLYEQMDSGALRSVKVGGRRLITRQAIEQFLSDHEDRP